jgi:parallel beta-helix repeat protein
LTGLLTLSFNIRNVKSTWTGTVYIRADGRIDPPDAPITTYDKITYTLTDNITSYYVGIWVERSDIVLIGNEHFIEGTGTYTFNGIYLTYVNNVTVKGFHIKDFTFGIYLFCSSNCSIINNDFINCGLFVEGSQNLLVRENTVNGKPLVYLENMSNVTVNYAGQVILVGCDNIKVEGIKLSKTTVGVQLFNTNNSIIKGNVITENTYSGILLYGSYNNDIWENNIPKNVGGIWLQDSSYNNVSGNHIASNGGGIGLSGGSNNIVTQNNITANECGISLASSQYNVVRGNYIIANERGIYLEHSKNNTFYHNDFIYNAEQVVVYWEYPGYYINFWDNGYPSGGNYWSDHSRIDDKSGPYQNETGSDGIVDVAYVINIDNQDRYPLTTPWGPISEYPFAEWIESPNYTPLGWRNVTYIIIHVMDGYFNGTIDWFRNPASQVSAHYLVSQEGEIVQMVREKNAAWHAGNWEYNLQSIGIEHEDKGNWDKPNWATEELYKSSAALVRYLCDKYGIPKDRAHIIGHNEVPGVTKPCPGPYWDWNYFMGLVIGVPTPRTFWAVHEGVDYPVLILSNSTISNFNFNQPAKQIVFNVTGASGAKGFCNLTIPKSLLKGEPWTITVDNTLITNFTATDNATHSFIYFTYTHMSTYEVTIQGTWVIPEFPTTLILAIFMLTTLITTTIWKAKRRTLIS